MQLVEEIHKLFFFLITINEQNRQVLLILDRQQILLHQLIPLKQNKYIQIRIFSIQT